MSQFKVKALVIIISFLFLIQVFNISSLSTNSVSVNKSLKTQLSNYNSVSLDEIHTLDTNIILVNYDNSNNFTGGILAKLPKTITVSNVVPSITYTMKYHFIFPNSTFTNQFKSFIFNNSIPNSTTVDINQTALAYQAQYNTVQNIFVNKNGTAINGTNVENWLWQYGQNFRPAGISYQIFLLNLTFIQDKTYWFDIPEPDEVTHQQRQEWRLEWDYPPFDSINNFNAKFPYPGYGSNHPMYFLDPSAFNWYLNWTRIWRNVPSGDKNLHYQNTFSGYLDNIGGFSSNKYSAGAFIGNWLNEIVSNLFVINPLSVISPPPSLNLQIAVITDDSQSNPYPNLQWAINKSIITNQLQQILPNETINVETNYFNISDHVSVQNLLKQNQINISPQPVQNYTYYNGYNISFYIPRLDSEFFGSSPYNLRAYVFILDNASFAGANWNGGGLFTGLGGGGRLLILNEVDRLFFNRTTYPVPKESLSKVIIHEAGHAIGLPHPFNEILDTYASDFVGDVMGYYPSTANFSFFMINNYQRLSFEPRINFIINNLAQFLKSNVNQSVSQILLNLYNSFIEAYKNLDFTLAKMFIDQIETLLKQNINLESPQPKAPLVILLTNGLTIYFGSEKSFSWQVYDLNPYNYKILINDSIIKSSYWNNSSLISYAFKPTAIATYKLTIIVIDKFNLSTSQSLLISVYSLPTSNTNLNSQSTGNNLTYPFIFIIPPLFLLSVFYYRKWRKS